MGRLALVRRCNADDRRTKCAVPGIPCLGARDAKRNGGVRRSSCRAGPRRSREDWPSPSIRTRTRRRCSVRFAFTAVDDRCPSSTGAAGSSACSHERTSSPRAHSAGVERRPLGIDRPGIDRLGGINPMRRTKRPARRTQAGHLVSPPFQTSGCRGLGNEMVRRHGLPIPGEGTRSMP